MKLFQKGRLSLVKFSDGSLSWKYVEADGFVTYFKQANVLTHPGYVYRAGSDFTLTPLLSTIRTARKSKNQLFSVLDYYPIPDTLRMVDLTLNDAVGYDFLNDQVVKLSDLERKHNAS